MRSILFSKEQFLGCICICFYDSLKNVMSYIYTFIAEKSKNAGKQKRGEIKLIILPPKDNSGTFLQIWAYNIFYLVIFT